MIDLLKKFMFAGIGMALKTKEEVEEFASDLVQRAELSENEGKKFVNDFLKRYDESREKLEEKVERTVKDLLAKANLVTREELTAVKDEIKHMRKTLAIEDSHAPGDDQ
ncbi:MAG: phasin family protein [Thermodesulfobacteriota bacterium]